MHHLHHFPENFCIGAYIGKVLGNWCNWCSGSATVELMFSGLNLTFGPIEPAPLGRLRLACEPGCRPSFTLSHNPSGKLQPSVLPVASTARQFPSRLKPVQPSLDRPVSPHFFERSEPFRLCTDRTFEWPFKDSGNESRHMRSRLFLSRPYITCRP